MDIGTCFQNEFFGEGSLLTAKPRRATATAHGLGETVCYTMSGRSFRLIFGEKLVSEFQDTLEVRKASDLATSGSDDTAARAAAVKAKSIAVNDLTGLRILGEGSYGKVTLVRHKTTGRTYALKQIKQSHVKQMKQEDHVVTELNGRGGFDAVVVVHTEPHDRDILFFFFFFLFFFLFFSSFFFFFSSSSFPPKKIKNI